MIVTNTVNGAAIALGYRLGPARAASRNTATLRLMATTGRPVAADQICPRDATTLTAAGITYRVVGGLQLTDAGRRLAARL